MKRKKDFFNVDMNYEALRIPYNSDEAKERIKSKKGFKKLFG